MKTFITELIPTNGRKSFYGRAHIIESDGWHYLKSYNTIVGAVDKSGKVHRYWVGRSNTTSSHINSFLAMFADPSVKKSKDFYTLALELQPKVVVEL